MLELKCFWKKRAFLNIFFALLILVLGFYCGKGIFTYRFFSTHDGDFHLARAYDAVKTLAEGHFPFRWAGSLNYFCGVPIFNFFYPLLYYLIVLINLLTRDVIESLKIIYLLSFTLSPLMFFFWLKLETKNILASFAGAVLYLFVPYRFLLVFVRSSPEFLAYTILPIFLYFSSAFFKEIKEKGKGSLILGFLVSFLGAMLIISHNLVAFLLSPLLSLWFIIKLWQVRKCWYENKWLLGLIIFVAFSVIGLSAFFWGPVFIEKGEVKLGKLDIINYWQHFPTLRQLIRSPWGYFYSAPGVKNDGISFSLGYAQWLVLGLAGIWLVIKILKHGLIRTVRENSWVLFFFFVSILAIFLMLKQSKFIWEFFSPLQEIQFPWRILGITSFTIAALTGFWLSKITNQKNFYILIFLILVLAVYGNHSHLLPRPLLRPERYSDFENLHEYRYSTTTLGDDILNKKAKRACYFSDPFLVINKKIIDYHLKRGNTFGRIAFFWHNGEKEKEDIRINLEYFPGIYRFTINGKNQIKIINDEGRIYLPQVSLKQGENIIEWHIVQSPTEKIFNNISLCFLIIWLIFIFAYAIKKNIKKQ